jgi:hypothetical protein
MVQKCNPASLFIALFGCKMPQHTRWMQKGKKEVTFMNPSLVMHMPRIYPLTLWSQGHRQSACCSWLYSLNSLLRPFGLRFVRILVADMASEMVQKVTLIRPVKLQSTLTSFCPCLNGHTNKQISVTLLALNSFLQG